MTFRRLRIVWSCAWLLVLLVLITFWVASYKQTAGTSIDYGKRRQLVLVSALGEIGIMDKPEMFYVGVSPSTDYDFDGFHLSGLNRTMYPHITGRPLPFKPRLRFTQRTDWWYVGAPFWLLTLFSIPIAGLPWVGWKRHYSLRSLFITMSIVAIVMGLTIYAARK